MVLSPSIQNLNPRTSKGEGGQIDPKLKLSSNQNETFSTCSLIMSALFIINWMTSSHIVYA